MPQLERYEPLVKDHSSFIIFKGCPRKYFYRVVLGYDVKKPAPWLSFGSAYHKFRECFELEFKRLLAEGKSREDAALFAFQPALKAAEDYYKKHRVPPDPAVKKYAFYTMERLILSCKEVWKHLVQEKKLNKIEVIATEQAFNVQLPDGSFRGGRFDEIIKWNGKYWGRDFKTTSKENAYYSRTLTPNHQFTLYTYAETKLVGVKIEGQLVEVLHNSAAKGPELWTFLATRTQAELDEFERESIVWNQMLDNARKQDIWPKNDNYYTCSFCDYHSVCSKATEQGQMAHLKNNYQVRVWDPSNPDGE